MEDTDKLNTADNRVHSSFGSQRPGSRAPVRVESRLPRPTLPHRPEVSEMMDIEPDDGESEIICRGRPSREVIGRGGELHDVPGFRRSPWDFEPGTHLVSGGPPGIPATHHASQSELTSLPSEAAAAHLEGRLNKAISIIGSLRQGQSDRTLLTTGAHFEDQLSCPLPTTGKQCKGQSSRRSSTIGAQCGAQSVNTPITIFPQRCWYIRFVRRPPDGDLTP